VRRNQQEELRLTWGLAIRQIAKAAESMTHGTHQRKTQLHVTYDVPYIALEFSYDEELNSSIKEDFRFVWRWDPDRRVWLVKTSLSAIRQVEHWLRLVSARRPSLEVTIRETDAFRHFQEQESRKTVAHRRKEADRDIRRAEGLARYIVRVAARRSRKKFGDTYDGD
jgi:hypothetical protein